MDLRLFKLTENFFLPLHDLLDPLATLGDEAHKVVLAKGSHRVEGTEVLQILSLGAGPGDRVVLEVDGADAEQVLDALARLFADGFGPNE